MVYHPDHPQRRSVYYDDECKFCSDRAEKMLAEMDLDAYGISETAPETVSKEALMRDVHALDENGVMHKGIDAIILILRWHPRGKYIAPVLALPGIRHAGALVYRIIATNRYRWFGRR